MISRRENRLFREYVCCMDQIFRTLKLSLGRVGPRQGYIVVLLNSIFRTNTSVFYKSFMGGSPAWYKDGVIFCLVLNPVLFYYTSPAITGWAILIQFIATLALALKCYPLLPGGLIALEVVFLGMVSPDVVYSEIATNLPVILLLLFMVAGIHFMKDLLSWMFTKILIGIRSKTSLSITFCFLGAFLSAWLDALTVAAVMIAVIMAFYQIYTKTDVKTRVPDTNLSEEQRRGLAREDLTRFDGFLRNLIMHGLVGTAIGGVSTMVGEPQNLIIAKAMNWNFGDYFFKMAHITIPIVVFGFLTTFLVEKFRLFGYGYQLPQKVREILESHASAMDKEMNGTKRFHLIVQAIAAVFLISALAFHLAEVGLIGLCIIIFLTNFTGKSSEHAIGEAFQEATPFASLLIVFFVIVGMIGHTDLFTPVLEAALARDGEAQTYFFFFASGILSAISDNVFVATIYIQQAIAALGADHPRLPDIAMAINAGTNLPSIATPNGQAAFLFLLTNVLAARIHLSYMKMVKMAFPYLIVLTATAAAFLTLDWI